MNKFGFIVGITAATALVGCLDPDWQAKHQKKSATTMPGACTEQTCPAGGCETRPVEPAYVGTEPAVSVEQMPGEGDLTPIKIVETTPSTPVTPPPAATPAASATTPYIIQSGDSISKISKRYNIKVDAIKAANPGLTDVNKIRLGQTIQLPGTVNVGEQSVPAAATAPKAPAKPFVPYTGATKDYVVQKGDYLGKIAKKFGCTSRQLKELNGMTSDTVVLGRKMKVPANGATAPAVVKKPADPVTPPPVETKDEVKTPDAGNAVDETVVLPADEAAPQVEPPAPAPSAEYEVYEVKDGDDITSISILTDVSPAEIRQLNNLEDGAVLAPGMKLKMPLGTVQ